LLKKKTNEHPILTLEQKARVNNLVSAISDLFRHFRSSYDKLPKTTSLEEIAAIGNDKKSHQVANFVYSRFSMSLMALLDDGFNSWTLFGTHQVWDWVKFSATQRDGEYDTTAFSSTELEMGTAIAEIDLNAKYPSPRHKLKAFICSGLVTRGLHNWLELLLKNTRQLERFYYASAIWRIAATDCLDALSACEALPFSLEMEQLEQQ